MARTWLQIQVELLGGRGIECDPPPGRVFIVGPSQSFEQLAEAIDAAFARWDLSHVHEFELPDGRRVGFPSDEYAPDLVWEDHAALKVARELKPGQEFGYVFDFGDWRHRCRVLDEKADPVEEYGTTPRRPVAIWGWAGSPASTALAIARHLRCRNPAHDPRAIHTVSQRSRHRERVRTPRTSSAS